MRGIFTDQIIDIEVGTTQTYEALRNWIKEKSIINQGIEGRFTIKVPGYNFDQSGSDKDWWIFEP